MTQEEIARFAVVLREAERIREEIAKEEAALANDGEWQSEAIPMMAAA